MAALTAIARLASSRPRQVLAGDGDLLPRRGVRRPRTGTAAGRPRLRGSRRRGRRRPRAARASHRHGHRARVDRPHRAGRAGRFTAFPGEGRERRRAIARDHAVADVETYYASENRGQVSRDRRMTYVAVTFRDLDERRAPGRRVADRGGAHRSRRRAGRRPRTGRGGGRRAGRQGPRQGRGAGLPDHPRAVVPVLSRLRRRADAAVRRRVDDLRVVSRAAPDQRAHSRCRCSRSTS